MENTAHKSYRCTDHGSDATAHEDGIYFVVHAGSRFGPSENPNDRIALNYRMFLSREGAFEDDGLTLRGDERLLYADEAARVVTGRICDETSWTAADGSHPIVRRDART